MPILTRRLLFLLFLLSSFVFIEPSPFDIFFAFTLIFAIAAGHLHFSSRLTIVWILITLYVITSLVSLINADDLEIGLRFFGINLYLCILMLFISVLIDTYGYEPIEIIFKSITCSILISVILSLAGFFDVLPIRELIAPLDRLKGFFKDPNVFGPAVEVALMYVYYKINSTKAKRLRNIIIIIPLALAVLLAYSRAGWLALVLSLICYSFFITFQSRSKTAMLKFIFSVFGFIFIAGLSWIIADAAGLTELAKQRFALQSYDEDRFMVQRILFEKSFDYILGAGPGQSEVYLGTFYNNIEGSNSAQQTLLRIFFENGFPGALVFSLFLCYLCFLSLKISLSKWQFSGISAVVSSLFYGMLLCSIVVDTLHWRHFWVIAGMICGLYILYSRRNSTYEKTGMVV